jgi:hypothetical protein
MNMHFFQLPPTVPAQTLATVSVISTSFPVTCTMNCAPYVKILSIACAKYLTDHPVKRARESEGHAIQARSCESLRVGLFKRVRLSKLFTLSLDILSEVRC